MKYSSHSSEIRTLAFNNGEYLKIAFISDLQISLNYDFTEAFKDFQEHFKITLKYLKKLNLDIIVICGDLTDDGELESFRRVKEIINSEINDTLEKKPLIITIMGNHDYKKDDKPLEEKRRIYSDIFHDLPYSHYVINGFHFIFWSHDNDNNDENGVTETEWAEEQIKLSVEDYKKRFTNPEQPIFVITHTHPFDTVYGSHFVVEKNKSYSNKKILHVFKNYPNIINLSGHTHFSLMNPNSIFQKDFTVIGTQAISYFDYEVGRENGDYDVYNIKKVKTKPKYLTPSLTNYMGIIADINKNEAIFSRVSFDTGNILDDKWIIQFPINKTEFKYTKEEMKNNVKNPFFDNNEKIEILNEKNLKILKFKQANEIKNIFEYKVILINLDDSAINYEFIYFSDFFLPPNKRNIYCNLYISNKVINGKYKIKIFAIDFYENKSFPLEQELIL